MKKELYSILIISLLFAGCKKEPEPEQNCGSTSTYDQQALLDNWADELILPGYFNLERNLSDLVSFGDHFTQNPTVLSLEQLRANWHDSYLFWERISMIEIGPAADRVLRSNTNIYPTDTAKIEENIRNGVTDLSGASLLDEKGFPAIDYLINYGADTSIIKAFQQSPERVAYLMAVIREIHQNVLATHHAWSPASGNYSQTFKSATGANVGSSLGLMINAINQHMERNLRDGKIGIPNGERSFSGDPLPGHVEAVYKGDFSKRLIQENLEGLEKFYLGTMRNGTNGMGLDDALNSISATHNGQPLDATIQQQFKSCYEALDAVPGTMQTAVVNNSAEVSALFKEMQKLVILFKADIPSSLGVLITYQDNDGD